MNSLTRLLFFKCLNSHGTSLELEMCKQQSWCSLGHWTYCRRIWEWRDVCWDIGQELSFFHFVKESDLKSVPVTEVCLKHECDCTHNNSKRDVDMFKQLKWWLRNWIAFYGFYFPPILLSVVTLLWPILCFSLYWINVVISLLPFADCPQWHLSETGLGFFSPTTELVLIEGLFWELVLFVRLSPVTASLRCKEADFLCWVACC